jgi:hypothetical protein
MIVLVSLVVGNWSTTYVGRLSVDFWSRCDSLEVGYKVIVAVSGRSTLLASIEEWGSRPSTTIVQ